MARITGSSGDPESPQITQLTRFCGQTRVMIAGRQPPDRRT